jgi:putative YphP/YqiW family bacilliredoxin
MYPEHIVKPFREELTRVGFQELQSPEAVDTQLTVTGTTLLVVNSVCGCAAGTCRPGVTKSLETTTRRPDHAVTVFAGVDTAATARAREHLLPYPPSSPSIALFKDGKLVHMIERHHIEGRSADMIAENLRLAYDQYCN